MRVTRGNDLCYQLNNSKIAGEMIKAVETTRPRVKREDMNA
jgi:hypothetical protein